MTDKILYQEILAFKNIDTSGHSIECHGLSIPKDKRMCIFCGRQYPEVKFSKDAHAISETVGNKILLSHLECDECNIAFGNIFEDSLGKYMAPFKYISGIYGKKNSLTIKDISDDPTLSYKTYRLEKTKNSSAFNEKGVPKNYIIEKSGSGIFKEIPGGFSLKIPRQKYNPMYVYMAFLKMAYSILPLHFLENYGKQMCALSCYVRKKEPFDFLDEQEKYISSLPHKGFFAFFPGYNPLNGVSARLLYRSDESSVEYPRILFQLDFCNFVICIPVLSDTETGLLKMQCPTFPNAQIIDSIDFTKEYPFFTCEFSALKHEISKSEYDNLSEILRQNNLLKMNETE